MEEYLEIGKVINTHGVKGEVKVMPLTDDLERFEKLKWVYVDRKVSLEKYNITSVKYLKGSVILKFKEISDMSQAEAMKDLFLKVDRKNAVKLPEDSFFICDLLGCEVYNEDGIKLGELTDILKTGSNDVYIVKDENKKEILIPALKSVVNGVSIENKRIDVSLPKGLLEDEI